MIPTTIDHIAIAVPHPSVAVARYRNEFGGGSVASGRRAGVSIDQIVFPPASKLEIVAPDPQHPNRKHMEDFLMRYGSVVHHVTLLVDSVAGCADILAGDGVRVLGSSTTDPRYHEAFVHPSDAGGVMVQLSWKDVDDEGWARRHGHVVSQPRKSAPRFLGARWSHQNLRLVTLQWERLGARVVGDDYSCVVDWPNCALKLFYVSGGNRVVEELLFEGINPVRASAEAGPAVTTPCHDNGRPQRSP